MEKLKEMHDAFMTRHNERMSYLYEHEKQMQCKEEERKTKNSDRLSDMMRQLEEI